MKIGFIGLGIMGSRMATNLQKSGYDLVVYNRTPEKAQSLLDGGAVWADSPAQVAQQVELLFTMLAKPDVVEALATGQDGFLHHLPERSLWVDFSTVNPSFARHMAQVARQAGVRYVDAPVAGTKGPAEQGQLVILVGGDAQDVAECQPYFAAVGRQVIHAGGQGMGTALKMVTNLLLGQAMAAFAEALALGQSLGIPQETLMDFLIGGPVVPAFIAGKRAKIAGREFQAEFPLRWMYKDLQLAAVTAYEQGVSLPVGTAAKEVYALAERYGLGGQDFSAIYAFLNDLHPDQDVSAAH